jgi:hypothetical protein
MKATEAKLLAFLKTSPQSVAVLDEIPSVMGLVRQSCERQMGSGDDA